MSVFRFPLIAVCAGVLLVACGETGPTTPVAMPEPIVAADLPVGSPIPMDQAVGLPEEVAIEWAELSGWPEIVVVEPDRFYGMSSGPAIRIMFFVEDGVVVKASAG